MNLNVVLGLALGLGSAAPLANANCLPYQIKFSQQSDRFQWQLSWNTQKPADDVYRSFTENAGAVLEGRSEVVQSMRWRAQGAANGNLETWVLVDIGIAKQKKYFLRRCSVGAEVNCDLDTSLGGGAAQINWQKSKLSCQAGTCTYQEQGSIKGIALIASAQKVSVGVNVQGMKDALRLAISSEYGASAVNRGYQLGRGGVESFWNQSQPYVSNKSKSFAVNSRQACR